MRVVVDANLLVALAVPVDYSPQASQKVRGWLADRVALFAPTLWGYEAASTIRKFVAAGRLDRDIALAAMTGLAALGVQEVNPSPELHCRALEWAELLGERVAYDAAYLALAEQLGSSFWTADGRFARKAKGIGLDWVHDVADPRTTTIGP